MVRPEIVKEEPELSDAPIQLPEELSRYWYPVIALPPLLAGVIVILIALSRRKPEIVGADGVVAGVATTEADVPRPMKLFARTDMVYAVPFVRLDTVKGFAPEVSVHAPELTWYWCPVITLPPLKPSVKPIDNAWLSGVPDTSVGAEGVVAGVIGAEGEELTLSPKAFDALI